MVNVLYIHGFNSSPLSLKAEQTRKYLNDHFLNIQFHCPQLANTPMAAIKQLEGIIQTRHLQTWCLMGSSLGGYFSTYLSEKFNLPAVLINPAVKPYILLCDYLGEQVNPYTNDVYQVHTSHIDDLKSLECENLTANNYLVMVQKGDEVLNYQEAVEKYQHCQLHLEEAGDHSFVGYEKKLPSIASFFQWY